MIAFMQGMMVRVFAGGVICAAALVVAGDGAKREIVRLCCACLMLILVLTPVQGVDFSFSELAAGREDIQRQVDDALARAEADRAEQSAEQLAGYIEGLATEQGLACTAQVRCTLGEDGVLAVEAVTLICPGGEAAALELIRLRAAQDLGIGADKIVIIEEGTP